MKPNPCSSLTIKQQQTSATVTFVIAHPPSSNDQKQQLLPQNFIWCENPLQEYGWRCVLPKALCMMGTFSQLSLFPLSLSSTTKRINTFPPTLLPTLPYSLSKAVFIIIFFAIISCSCSTLYPEWNQCCTSSHVL